MKPARFTCLALLLVTLAPLSLLAQPPEIQWTWNFGDDGFERALIVRATPDGGVIMAGDYTEVIDGPTDMYVAKLAADGQPEWIRPYGYPDDMETAFDITPLSDGGYMLVGFTSMGTSGGMDDLGNSYILRLNSIGDTLWTRLYDFGGIDDIYGALELDNGDILVAGTTEIEPTNPPRGDVFLIRFTREGDSLWMRVIHEDYTQWLNDFIRTSDGGFALAGIVNPPAEGGDLGFFAMKLNSEAQEEWYRCYGWPWSGYAYNIFEAGDGGFFLTGLGFDSTITEAARVTRVNANGDTLWNRVYDLSPGGDLCLGGGRDYDGGLLLACSNYYFTDPPQENFDLVKIDTLGNLVWQAVAAPTGYLDMPSSACATADGGYVIAGITFWPNDPDREIGNIYAVKLMGTESAPPSNAQLPRQFALAQNYPNPFNPSTEIAFDLPEAAHVSLSVFNVLGQKVATLLDEMNPAGTYQAQWDGTDMPSGIYFYRLEAGDFAQTKKMVLMK